MKRYKPFFKEKFLTAKNVIPYNSNENKYIELYINPNTKEIKEIQTISKYLRGILLNTGDVIVWRGDLTHWDVLEFPPEDLKKYLKGDKFNYKNRNYVTIKINSFYDIDLGDGEQLDSVLKENNLIDMLIKMENKTPFFISKNLKKELNI